MKAAARSASGRGAKGSAAPAAAPAPLSDWCERLALWLLVSLVPLRAFLAESHSFELPAAFRHFDSPGAVSPAVTIVIAVVILLAAALVALARATRGAYRWTGAEVGGAVLALALVVSTLRAGQKHLAATGAIDFAGFVVYFIALCQVLTRPWRVRLLMTVILATGGVVLAKCAYQHWVELPSTVRMFEENKEQVFGSPRRLEAGPEGFMYDYEQRLRSGAATAFFAHPNVLGSYLILILLAALAVVVARWPARQWPSLVAPAAVVVLSAVALAATQSKGAAVACAVALALAGVGVVFRRYLGMHRGRAAVALWLLGVAAAAALAVQLHRAPDSLGRSMLFRDFYWRGASVMLHEQGWLGIGSGNFGRIFSRYKDAECPEDVDDPHGWPIKALVEWGAIGLGGLLLVFAGITRQIVKAHGGAEAYEDSVEQLPTQRSTIVWAGAVALAVFVPWAVLLASWGAAYVREVLYIPVFAWMIAFLGLVAGQGESRFFSNRASVAATAGLAAGAFGFLLHSGIDLAMFNGAAATLFLAMLAVLRGVNAPDAPRAPEVRKGPLSLVALLVLIALVVMIRFGLPVWRYGRALDAARFAKQPAGFSEFVASPSGDAYRRAIDVYSLDAAAVVEYVDELAARARRVEDLDEAIKYLDALDARDPQSRLASLYRARLLFRRFQFGGRVADVGQAIEAMRDAVAAYPSSVARRLGLAEMLEALAAVDQKADTRAEAAAQLRMALEFDARRVYVSAPNRMTAEQRRAIEARIRRLTAFE